MGKTDITVTKRNGKYATSSTQKTPAHSDRGRSLVPGRSRAQKTTDTVRVPYQECKPRGGHFRLDIVSVIADFGTARLTQFRRTSTKSIHNSTASCQRQIQNIPRFVPRKKRERAV
ncbi:GD17837 [Drosophila simulans]|uniref:GD17837 n=1 Tax=Drosophila simulans TaxID=7240 RepID=B4Q5Y2_DROSI|nr:GD17837 [Drosophila simulans]